MHRSSMRWIGCRLKMQLLEKRTTESSIASHMFCAKCSLFAEQIACESGSNGFRADCAAVS
eukprot:1813383-Amphidinium_carterae.1